MLDFKLEPVYQSFAKKSIFCINPSENPANKLLFSWEKFWLYAVMIVVIFLSEGREIHLKSVQFKNS